MQFTNKPKMKIVFASNNEHKVRELQQIVGTHHQLISLAEIGITEDIPEPYETLEENALAKAQFVFQRTGFAAFADDTGLEVNALNGQPGVYSARYAGPQRNANDNMKKLLQSLENQEDRSAQFRTVIAWGNPQGENQLFEGIVRGEILHAPIGHEGFGYDPIFCPETYTESFAQLSASQKNSISHRGRAVQKFIQFLNTL